MAKQFHKEAFDQATKTKLEIFDEYFNACIPVFIHQKYSQEIFVYDLFAGKGMDENGEYGTSLNILKGLSKHCKSIVDNGKKLYVVLNDKDMSADLDKNVSAFIDSCRNDCSLVSCYFEKGKNLIIKGENFKTYFNDVIYPKLQKRGKAMKLIFLDPFNFVLDEVLFKQLTSLQRTDFICFMPSSILRRFSNEPAFKNFVDSHHIKFDDTRYVECHRTIADCFRSLAPKGYYIGHFSIEKPQRKGLGKNYYGLIFGSNHSFGSEKFQKVCWDIDKITGEANYNIDRELIYGGGMALFPSDSIPLKIQKFRNSLKEQILKGTISSDIDAYKYALQQCCLPKHGADVLKEMMGQKQIKTFKVTYSNIHSLNPTKIDLT